MVFLGVGFETTAPTVAAALLTAAAESLANFTVLSDHKVMPPPMRALMEAPDVRVRGFLCPGHVSTIIGSDAYRFLAEEFGASCVVAGFEPLDILQAVLLLLRQAAAGEARVENAYGRAVTPAGNWAAQELLRQAFVPMDAEWRGFGVIPASGLAIAPALAAHDAVPPLRRRGAPGPRRPRVPLRTGTSRRRVCHPSARCSDVAARRPIPGEHAWCPRRGPAPPTTATNGSPHS